MANSAAKPLVRVREATPADLDRIVDVFYDAFGGGIMQTLMHPGGVSASAKAGFASSFFPEEKKDAQPSPSARADGRVPRKGERIVAVAELLPPDAAEDAVGEIIAMSRWTLHREPREEWEWNVDDTMTAEDLGEGANVEITNAFLGGLKQLEKKYTRGDPHVVLSILATESKRHRSGAGSALLRWGYEIADREGLPLFLEASPSGYPLYKRMGFEPLDVQDLDLKGRWNVEYDGGDWGSDSAVELAGPVPDGAYRSVLMRRLPNPV